jgi:hypothetical protein
MTITLTPELERAVTTRANQQGTTPEMLALDVLREHFLPVAPEEPREGTLADFLLPARPLGTTWPCFTEE